VITKLQLINIIIIIILLLSCRSPEPNLLQHQDTTPHTVNLRLTLLKMDKNCPKHVELILEINKSLLLHLVGLSMLFTYIDDTWSNTNQIQCGWSQVLSKIRDLKWGRSYSVPYSCRNIWQRPPLLTTGLWHVLKQFVWIFYVPFEN